MNKLLPFTFLLFFSLNILSQSRYGNEFPEGTIKSMVSQSGDFYVGIDNPLRINIPGYSPELYTIKTNNGSIFNDSLGLAVIPIRAGNIRFMIYRQTSDNTDEYLGFARIRVHRIPEPKLIMDSIIVHDYTQITFTQLMSIDSLSIHISNDIIGSREWFSIKEFTFGYNYGGIYKGNNNPGNKFTQETRKLIGEMNPGRDVSINAIIQSNSSVSKVLPVVRIFVY